MLLLLLLLLPLELELEPEMKLELNPVRGKELGLGSGIRVVKYPAAGPRRNRKASRKRRLDLILCCCLGQVASAWSPGASYSAQWGFPHSQFVEKEEATREHVTALGGYGHLGT